MPKDPPKYSGVLSTDNLKTIRAAWKKGKRSVTINDDTYTLEHAAHKSYILVRGPNGLIAQVEKVHYNALKSTDKEGRKLV